jgi:hypothetical protein
MGKMRTLCVVGVMAVMGVVACGSDKTPVEKCDDLVYAVCGRGASCLPQVGAIGQCVEAMRQSLACGSITSVTASYDRCMSQLEDASCATLFEHDPIARVVRIRLPADCGDALKTGSARPGAAASMADGWLLDGLERVAAPPER